jgi:hypothetical protein
MDMGGGIRANSSNPFLMYTLYPLIESPAEFSGALQLESELKEIGGKGKDKKRRERSKVYIYIYIYIKSNYIYIICIIYDKPDIK